MKTTTPTSAAAICPQSTGWGSCAAVEPDVDGKGRSACETCGGTGAVLPGGCTGRLLPGEKITGRVAHDEPCPLHGLPRTSDHYGDGQHLFACPLPVYRMVENPADPDGDHLPKVVDCDGSLMYEVTDGGQFYEDLDEPLVGAQWRITCTAGHVLVFADGVDDVPSADLAYLPGVAIEALHHIWGRA
jgi:hypothetical protein